MPQKNKHIIIVNDAVAPLSWMVKILKDDYPCITTFTESSEALEHIQNAIPPDLIIIDLNMTRIDGLKFCRLARSPEFKGVNNVPVLIVSSCCKTEPAGDITKGLGASCFISLPCEKTEFLKTVRSMLQLEFKLNQPKVLVIDDSDDVQNLLSSVLSTHGHVVFKAKDGKSGLQMVRTKSPDIVILDHVLPDTTGLELVPEIKKNGNPILISITGNPTPRLAIDYSEAGAESYIQKPISAVYLIDLINKLYRERAIFKVETMLSKRTKELRRIEIQYRAVVDHMDRLVCRFKPDYTITFANNLFYRETKIPHPELKNKKFTDIINPSETRTFNEATLSLNKDNPALTIDVPLLINGKTADYRWTLHVIMDENGNPDEYQCVGYNASAPANSDTPAL